LALLCNEITEDDKHDETLRQGLLLVFAHYLSDGKGLKAVVVSCVKAPPFSWRHQEEPLVLKNGAS